MRPAGDQLRAERLAARANLRGADPQRYLAGQHQQHEEPPVLASWAGVDSRITRYCEKAMRLFADRAAVGVEQRLTDAEEAWVIWCAQVIDGRRVFTVINDRTRRAR